MGTIAPIERPIRAPDVKPGGEMRGTGFERPQWLIQRGDRYLQVSELLYRIAGFADGSRSPEEIAVLVSAATRRDIHGQDVRELIATKLVPSGIISNGTRPLSSTAPSMAPSPLGVALRATILGPNIIDPLARLASIFFAPGVALAVVAVTVATRVWLYTRHGVTPGIDRVLHEPSLMVLLGALAIGGAAFHELGHAAALRVAGGRARGMGVGLYFAYPVFYTDVTDSYRLGRWRRVLTDLGGFHFNFVFALFVLGAYVLTRNEALVVAVSLIDLEVLHQMLPLGRLDGYWLLADLTGVPDFFSLAGAYMRGLLRRDGAMPDLRPTARVVFGLYLALIGPVLIYLVVIMLSRLPIVAFSALDSFVQHAARFDEARASQDVGAGIRAVGETVLLMLPLLAIGFFLASVARALARSFLKIAGDTRGQRLAGVASAVAGCALVVALWSPLSSTVAAGVHDAAQNVNAIITEGVVDPSSNPTAPVRSPTKRPASVAPRSSSAPTAAPTAVPTVRTTAAAPPASSGAVTTPSAMPASPSPTASAAPSSSAPAASPSPTLAPTPTATP